MKRIGNLKYYLGYGFIWLCLHFYMRCDYLDDMNNRATYLEIKDHFFSGVIQAYNAWDPRIIIYPIMIWLTGHNIWIWKILDILIMCLLVYSLAAIFNEKGYKSNLLLVMALTLCYPFCHQGSTGWIATTVNHIWTVSFGMYCLSVLVDLYREKKVSAWKYITFCLALIYSTNQIIMTTVMILLILFWLYKMLSLKGRNKGVVVVSCISVIVIFFNVVIYILCPGNEVRNQFDAMQWEPNWDAMRFIDKIRLGVVEIWGHIVSIPNFLYFIFCALIAVKGWEQLKGSKKWICFCPLIIDCLWSAYFLFIIVSGKAALDYYIPNIFIKDSIDMVFQGGMLVSWLISVLLIMLSVKWIIPDDDTYVELIFFAVLSHVGGMIVAFSPTVMTSSLRSNTILYISLIACILILLKEPIRTKYLRYSMKFVIAIGIMVNVVQVVRHIKVWG